MFLSPKPEDVKCNNCANCLEIKVLEHAKALAIRCKLGANESKFCTTTDFSKYVYDEDLRANNILEDVETKKKLLNEVTTSVEEQSIISGRVSKILDSIQESMLEINKMRSEEKTLKDLSKSNKLFLQDLSEVGTYKKFIAKEKTTVGLLVPKSKGFQSYSVGKNQIIEGTCIHKAVLNPIVKDLISESMYESIIKSFGIEAYYLSYRGTYGIALQTKDFEEYVE